MNKQLNISVFGLKLTTIDELKRIIEGLLPEHYNVNWTNINDASLDILLISHLFYDLPNIVSIRQRPNLKTLKIAHDPLLQGQLVQDTFYLPVESNGIRLWFEQHVLEVTQPSNPLTTLNNLNSKLQPEPKPQGTQIDNLFKQLDIQKTIPALNNQPIVANTAVNATTISASQTVKPVKQPSYQEQIKRASQQIIEPRFVRAKSALQGALFYEAIHYKHFENLQHKLWQSTDYRQCILIAGDTKIALIDKPHNQFWLANGLTTVGQSSIHLQHADLNNVVRFCHKNQPYDLQYGLWNFVWQNVGAIVPSYTGYYRLKYYHNLYNIKIKKIFLKLLPIYNMVHIYIMFMNIQVLA